MFKNMTEAEMFQMLYEIVEELELRHGRKFSLDGHLVGSYGEIYAVGEYRLALNAASAKTHDATSPCGKKTQIKVTQIHKIGISSEPEHLLVLLLKRDGKFDEVYNGPGSNVWNAAGPMQKNGQRQISLTTLSELAREVNDANKIARTP